MVPSFNAVIVSLTYKSYICLVDKWKISLNKYTDKYCLAMSVVTDASLWNMIMLKNKICILCLSIHIPFNHQLMFIDKLPLSRHCAQHWGYTEIENPTS